MVAAAFRNRRALITGGLGFIGSSLALRLVQLGAEVTVIDSLIPDYGGNPFNLDGFADRVRINISDIRDRASLTHLVRGQHYLFNLAAQSGHMDSMRDPFTDLDINARAQLNLLEACREHSPDIKIVYASTRQVCGRPQYLPVDERHPTNPVDVNGINKLAGEWYHILYNNVYGIRTCILRLTNTYGPRMRVRDARQTFLGLWVRLAVQGQPFEVWGGDQVRDFTYVDDAVEAFLLAAASSAGEGQVFHLGGERPVSLKAVADILVRLNGGGECFVRPYPAARQSIEIGDYYGDWQRIRSELGWQPRVPLEDGLGRTLSFYREHLDQYL